MSGLWRADRINEACTAVDQAIAMFEQKESLVEAERARQFAAALAAHT